MPKISEMSDISYPSLDDELYIISGGSSYAISARKVFGNFLPGVCGGRLTTETAVPISTSDRATQSTIYFTPYDNSPFAGHITLFDATRWSLSSFSELSLSLSGLSGDTNYDLFVWSNAGTITLSKGPAWSSATSRGTGAGTTELVKQNGIWLNKFDISSGPNANTGKYVGSFRASAATTTEDTDAKRFVWNNYNRVKRRLKKTDTTNSWTSTDATFHTWNGVGNRVEFILGHSLDQIVLQFLSNTSDSVGNTSIGLGIGLDSTTSNSADIYPGLAPAFITLTTILDTLTAFYESYPGIGYHYLQLLEVAGGLGTTTFYGDNNQTFMQGGALGYLYG